MQAAMQDAPRFKWKKLLLQFGLGGLAGFGAAFAVDRFAWGAQLDALGPSAAISGGIGTIYLVVGLFMVLGLLVPRIGARLLNVEDEGELLEQRRMLAAAAIGMALMGAMMITLALSGPDGPVSAPVALAVLAVGSVVLVLVTRYQLRHMDELMRSISREAAAWSFYLLLLFGGGWAALGHLRYVPMPAPLDWISLFAGLVLVASFIVTGLRGMLAPR